MRYVEVKTIMFKNGYSIKSTKGSHVVFYKAGCINHVSIPNNNGRDINKMMLKRLFKENNIIIQ